MNDPRWDSLTDAQWDAFATAWIAELSGTDAPPLPDLPLFEQVAEDDPLFANMLKGCYQYQMTDDVWQRLRAARGDAE